MRSLWLILYLLIISIPVMAIPGGAAPLPLEGEIRNFRESVENLEARYPERFRARPILNELDGLDAGLLKGDLPALDAFRQLKRRAFLAHPRLREADILAIRIGLEGIAAKPLAARMQSIGQLETHLSLSSVPENAPGGSIIRIKSDRLAAVTLVEGVPGQPLAGIDLHWQGDRFLYSRRANGYWEVFEQRLEPGINRQISRSGTYGVDAYDAAYLPDGNIVFGSDAPEQGVPCWHGIPNRVANLYVMDESGGQVRQLCYDQGHNAQPFVLRDGRVIFNRWDYTGMNRVFNQFVMQMRPDGTNQKIFYGTNTWFPNGTFGHRELPDSNRLVCIVSGYHGTYRSGYLGILDPALGDRGGEPLVQIITGTPYPAQRIVADRWMEHIYPKFTDPYPLDDQYFLASVMRQPGTASFEICLVDVFNNVVPLYSEDGAALLNPVLVGQRPVPHQIASQVDLGQDHATVFIQDVYRGPGLAGVPRGVAKKIRVIAYDYGYPTLAGVDKIGMTGPWEVVQILGEADVQPDGSAYFKMPADTPVAFQVVDASGQAVQLMRSWTTAMPGEPLSCVGCHEPSTEVATRHASLALGSPPQELEPWQGPARGFDFSREIQPFLNHKCASCHDGKAAAPDLRPVSLVSDYEGPVPSHYDRIRMEDAYKKKSNGESRVNYSPAYEALVDSIRRVGAGDGVSQLNPGEYSANTSPLVQILRKGHHGVNVTAEEMERLYTWIDLNGPQHGSWLKVFGMPPVGDSYRKRYEMRQRYDSKQQKLDPQAPIAPADDVVQFAAPVDAETHAVPKTEAVTTVYSPPVDKFNRIDYRRVGIGQDLDLTLVRIPAGQFMMGSDSGYPDEQPAREVRIESEFWMAEAEITNALFHAFKAEHDSGFLQKRHDIRPDNQGVALNRPDQPVVRVSWEEAMAFCGWLTSRSGIEFTLPTEEQWEYACRAGGNGDFFYGNTDADFGAFANLADRSFAREGVVGPSGRNLFMTASDLESLHTDLVALADTRSRDGFIGTCPVDHFESNPFGLKNMHGNAAEWTLSAYDTGRDPEGAPNRFTERVVRGGSFTDAPSRATASFRLPFPQWQRVHDVGFRVVAGFIP